MTTRTSRSRSRTKAAERPVVEEASEEPQAPTPEPMPPDLLAVIKATYYTPQVRAKMVRFAFSAHPEYRQRFGSVRQFLMDNGIPIVDTPASKPAPEAAKVAQG